MMDYAGIPYSNHKKFGDKEFEDNLLQDLKKIHIAIRDNGHPLDYEDNIMDTDAYKRFRLAKKQTSKYYCISSAFIHGVPNLKKSSKVAPGAGHGFVDVKKECYLESKEQYNDYFYWPLNLSNDMDRDKYPKYFNVCAICFGAMMLNNWNTYDRLFYGIPENKKTKDAIFRSINLLLSLRDYYKMSWLSKWDFGPKLGAEAGTINQTTLSLSTLLTCGFLDRMEGENDNNKLYNRIKFVDNSLLWLEGKEKMKKLSMEHGIDAYYWGNGYSEELNLSLSLFCLDVYIKYYEKIVAAMKFSNAEPLPNIRDQETYGQYCTRIKNYINGIVKGINATVPAYIKKDTSNYDKLIIYSKVLKSFCGFLRLEIRNGEMPPLKGVKLDDLPIVCQTAVNLSKEALDFLYANKNLIEDFDSLKETDCELLIEHFPYISDRKTPPSLLKNPKEFDHYDNCVELLFIDAVINAVELDVYTVERKETQKPISRDELITTICDSIDWFQKKMIPREVPDFIYIKGHNGDLAPIYTYYYYRMVIYDYFVRLKGKEERETI